MSENLVEVVSRHMDANGGDGLFITPINGLFLMRWAQPAIPAHIIYRPALCLVVQGGKSISVGKILLRAA
jgi:hypothetical protein